MCSSPRDDHLGQLRREKALEAPHALQLAELGGDARLQFAVHRRDLLGTRTQFAEQPRILHRDHRLCREILQQRDLLVGERPHLFAGGSDHPEKLVVATQRHAQQCAVSFEFDRGAGHHGIGFRQI